MTSAETSPPPSPGRTALSPRARILLPAFLLLLAALTAYRTCNRPTPSVVSLEGATMGTIWSVKLAEADLGREAEQEIAREVTATLERVDALMSTWRADSELSRFNRHRGSDPFPVAPETFAVFEIAREVSELSGGAFDVTVAPLVQAWGFGAGAEAQNPPSEAEIAARREHVGYANLVLDPETQGLTKTHDGVTCDLSAVAKGFAVDEIARALERFGQHDFLVEVGGELRASGRHLDGSPWRVAIERPDPTSRSIHHVVELHDLSMATSGDYRNYYEVEGRRISHTLDPRTGRPITHSLASVTVFHADAAHADALATALNVLGPESGYHLATEREIAAFFIVRENGGSFRSFSTERFRTLFDVGRDD